MTPTDVYGITYWRIDKGIRRFPTLDDAVRFCRGRGWILLEARGYNRLGKTVAHLVIKDASSP